MLIESYADKAARLVTGDFSALINAPISASIGEGLWLVVQTRKVDSKKIGEFLRSRHFAEVPTVQLSARLFSAYKERIRLAKTPPDPTSNKTRGKLSGFFYDIQHAATYAPYCDAYFTDNAMAKLANDKRVNVEADFGCKVFSVDSKRRFCGLARYAGISNDSGAFRTIFLGRTRNASVQGTKTTPPHAPDTSPSQ